MTDPRNAGREDLRCPFGCRKHHRRQRANERSREHSKNPSAKKKKKLLNGRRGKSGNSAAVAELPALPSFAGQRVAEVPACEELASEEPFLEATASVQVANCDAATRDVANHSAVNHSAVNHDAVNHDAVNHDAVNHDAVSRGAVSRGAVSCPACPSARELAPTEGIGKTLPGRAKAVVLELPLEGFVLKEDALRNSSVLPYARMVVSLILGRTISREELLTRLLGRMRQHSIGRLSRREYVLHFLNQHPP